MEFNIVMIAIGLSLTIIIGLWIANWFERRRRERGSEATEARDQRFFNHWANKEQNRRSEK